jgi:hypothetical protein
LCGLVAERKCDSSFCVCVSPPLHPRTENLCRHAVATERKPKAKPGPVVKPGKKDPKRGGGGGKGCACTIS